MTAADKQMFNLGGAFIGGVFFCAQAIHWFNTPRYAAATQARAIGVGVQAVVGLIVAVAAFIYAKRVSAARTPLAPPAD